MSATGVAGANAEAEDDANATAPTTTSAVADTNFIMMRLSMQVEVADLLDKLKCCWRRAMSMVMSSSLARCLSPKNTY